MSSLITVYNKGQRTVVVKGFTLTPGKQHKISDEAFQLIKKMYPAEFEVFTPEAPVTKQDYKKMHRD